MKLEELYACMKENNTEQLISIIKYIENNHPQAEYDGSHKYHIPMWRTDDKYVGIGCRKHYISVYFSNRDAVNVVAENTLYCRPQKSCVNFSYNRELPLEAIFKGIDKCLG